MLPLKLGKENTYIMILRYPKRQYLVSNHNINMLSSLNCSLILFRSNSLLMLVKSANNQLHGILFITNISFLKIHRQLPPDILDMAGLHHFMLFSMWLLIGGALNSDMETMTGIGG